MTLSPETELHWLALRMTPGLGTRTAVQLIETFKTPEAVFRASRSELEAAGVSPGLAQSVASGCAFDDAVTQQQKLAEAGAMVVPLTDPRYPARLKGIFDPPPLLYARGRVELTGELMLGMVGTRRPTSDCARATLTRRRWTRCLPRPCQPSARGHAPNPRPQYCGIRMGFSYQVKRLFFNYLIYSFFHSEIIHYDV